MLFRNQAMKYGYMNEAGDGDGGAAGGSDGAGDAGDGSGDSAGGSDDLAAQLEALKGERDSLLGKVNELLGESKKAKDARRKAEQMAAEQERAKAEAEGNFEQLFRSSESERDSLKSQLEELQASIHTKEVSNEAMKLAVSLGPVTDAAAEDLAMHVARRLRFTDEGIKVTDDSGNLTVSTLDDLKREFSGSARYSHLVKGNQSSGGGATGGSSGGSAAKEMTRAEFNKLDPIAAAKFFKGGGKLTDS